MKSRLIKSGSVKSAALIVVAFVLFSACAKSGKQMVYEKEAMERGENCVSQIGGTNLGRLENIAVDFSMDIVGDATQALSLVPDQKGEWKIEGRRATFIPSRPYKAEQEITLVVDCKTLFALDDEAVYLHKYITDTVKYDIKFEAVALEKDDGNFSLAGTVTTDIPTGTKALKKSLKAKFGAFKNLQIEWLGKDENALSVPFKIGGISQGRRAKNMTISWNALSLGANKSQNKFLSDKKIIAIPAIGDFLLFDINTSERNKIFLSFSKWIDLGQNIIDFVNINPNNDKNSINANFRKNVVTIYSEENFQNLNSLIIASGIKSVDGKSIAMDTSIPLGTNWDLPSVEFASSGVILPTTQGTVIPVKTRNLSGLLIQAFLIHDWNINQFLQENELSGMSEMHRVGNSVWEKNLSFEWNDSMKNRFITRGIDVGDLIKKYPDGMLQLRVTFRHHNIKYVCAQNHDDFSDLQMPSDKIEGNTYNETNSYWNYLNTLPYEKRRTYWQNSSDPCHPAFYFSGYNRKNLIERNVLVSDIALMAKKDVNGNIYVTASDLKNARPLGGAEVELKNFAGKTLAKAKTDSNGGAVFNAKNSSFDPNAPHLITAAHAKQHSYLKLSYSNELSASHFETGGVVAQNGVKGFIYGERGVWRPGDNLFLTFVLQDLNNTMPSDFPATFELQDPSGRIVESRTIKENVNGFYPIQTSTTSDAPTGFYLATVKMGGAEWSRPLKIESVVPNKLSVKLQSASEFLTSGANRLVLEGAWLHGAKTPGYRADISMNFSAERTSFKGYSDYVFTSPRAVFEAGRDTVWEGTLGDNSSANVEINLSATENLPGRLRANFTSRIFEPSGAFSTETKSFVYSPYERYCGIKLPDGDNRRGGMLFTDEAHSADVVLLDTNANPIQSAELDYTIYKLDWRWWWEKDSDSDATYISNEAASLVHNGKVSIKNGRGKFDFRVDQPEWGRYLVLVSDSNKHSAGKVVYIDWPTWTRRAQDTSSESATMLALTTDKDNYTVGETAQISFPSGSGARALVTIEKSGQVLKQEWIETKNETTSYRLSLDAKMSPNVYAHISLIQPHGQTANSLPIRLYGIVPVNVENPATVLEPVITSAEQFEPHKNCSISISEKSGKEMTYTLAVVDEGLLGLTNFHAPSLRDEFYKKEASMLSSYDLYKYVVNAYSGKLETILAIGGSDADILDMTSLDSDRFTPVVKFFGPFALKAGEKKATEFEMPGYIGAVRIIAIAGNKGAYGSSEKSVAVKSNLMLHPSLPRTLGLDEKIQVPVTVFNGTDRAQNISVSLNVKSNASVLEQSEQSVSVPADDNAVVYFTVNTQEEGIAEFTVNASMTGAQTTATVPVLIESRGIPVSARQNFTVRGGETFNAHLASVAQSKTAKNTVEISTLPQMNMSERLKNLIRYPHGCIEQITSGAFPQLYLPGFLKLTTEENENIKKNVSSVLTRHKNYRTSTGGLAYWPGENIPSAWGSCYAAHFELEAKKNGYDVDENLLKPLLDWLASTASSWNVYSSDSYENGTEVQAYRLFVLALAGRADNAAMNRLSDGVAETNNTTARLLLAAAYSLANQKSVAVRLMRGIEFAKNKFRYTGGSLNSSVRERAVYLFACGVSSSNADNIAKEVADTLASDEWLSTQEIAWSLIALLPWYKAQGSGAASYKITAEGKTTTSTLEGAIAVEDVAASAGATQSAQIENTGNKTLYGTFTTSGISVPGTERARADGLELTARYLDKNTAINPANAKRGDSFTIELTVKNTSKANLKNLALTLPIPTCWEIANERLALSEDNYAAQSQSFTYQDIRDDCIYTYFDLGENKSITLRFTATVAYSGEYFIPAIHVEAMYDNEIAAVRSGTRAAN